MNDDKLKLFISRIGKMGTRDNAMFLTDVKIATGSNDSIRETIHQLKLSAAALGSASTKKDAELTKQKADEVRGHLLTLNVLSYLSDSDLDSLLDQLSEIEP